MTWQCHTNEQLFMSRQGELPTDRMSGNHGSATTHVAKSVNIQMASLMGAERKSEG
jgi:hypothetical protein